MKTAQDFRRGHPVWDTDQKQPNGYIYNICWPDRTVTVKFYDGNYVDYDFDDIEYAWTDKFGGGWWLR